MEAARIAKIEDGAPSAVESAGSTSIVSEQDDMKVCPHRYCGCISQNGYTCTNPGPCDPVNENGRRFVVFECLENGQPLAHRHYLDDVNGVPLKKRCGPVIDADIQNAYLAGRQRV